MTVTVTFHHITNKIKMITRVLCTVCVNKNHTGKNLKSSLKSEAEERNITEKILAITADNASNIVAVVRELCWHPLSCFTNTINLGSIRNFEFSFLLKKLSKTSNVFQTKLYCNCKTKQFLFWYYKEKLKNKATSRKWQLGRIQYSLWFKVC